MSRLRRPRLRNPLHALKPAAFAERTCMAAAKASAVTADVARRSGRGVGAPSCQHSARGGFVGRASVPPHADCSPQDRPLRRGCPTPGCGGVGPRQPGSAACHSYARQRSHVWAARPWITRRAVAVACIGAHVGVPAKRDHRLPLTPRVFRAAGVPERASAPLAKRFGGRRDALPGCCAIHGGPAPAALTPGRRA